MGSDSSFLSGLLQICIGHCSQIDMHSASLEILFLVSSYSENGTCGICTEQKEWENVAVEKSLWTLLCGNYFAVDTVRASCGYSLIWGSPFLRNTTWKGINKVIWTKVSHLKWF